MGRVKTRNATGMMGTVQRGRKRMATLKLLGKGGRQGPNDDLSQAEDDIEFAKRDLPDLPFNTLGFANYIAFLACFLIFTMSARTNS